MKSSTMAPYHLLIQRETWLNAKMSPPQNRVNIRNLLITSTTEKEGRSVCVCVCVLDT